jgi:hypothetical protein
MVQITLKLHNVLPGTDQVQSKATDTVVHPLLRNTGKGEREKEREREERMEEQGTRNHGDPTDRTTSTLRPQRARLPKARLYTT